MPATVRVLLMLFTVATLTACGTGGGTRSNPRDDSDQDRHCRPEVDPALQSGDSVGQADEGGGYQEQPGDIGPVV